MRSVAAFFVVEYMHVDLRSLDSEIIGGSVDPNAFEELAKINAPCGMRRRKYSKTACVVRVFTL